MSQLSLGRSPPTSATSTGRVMRVSMPAPVRTPEGTTSAFVNQAVAASPSFRPVPEAETPPAAKVVVDDPDAEPVELTRSASRASQRSSDGGAADDGHQPQEATSHTHSRSGSMNKAFKFPTPTTSPTIGGSAPGPVSLSQVAEEMEEKLSVSERRSPAPSNIDIPPPPPIEKEPRQSVDFEGDAEEEEVGDTVDIPLN
ncbi:hypothetical protein FISHEDRAFT_58470 [Fistulina hepatica ATCC 64428]|uniref:Uncharacterized protein n=1 Tax=Fistulina hepatica ATCC 64428 TaxID=1128425 RepID=A0A0D7AGV4_9AGAR|nr:hypothetical protein FISHEDRAFT_58470 [Fistulina hepatica ATCC 64428]